MPNLQAFMTSKVDVKEQGELQGGLTSLVSITTIIGPLMMTELFYYATSDNNAIDFAGAPFLLGGIFMVLSFVITWLLLKDEKNLTE